jgi:glycolate oxidase FAD binding subunit
LILSGDASLKRLLDEVEARPPGPADPTIDGLSPSLVLEPSTEEGCSRALALCQSERMAVVPLGGGTRLDVGNPPSRLDVYLSTRALAGIVDHVEGDLTVAVRAGTSIETLNRELARAGQFLPLDPPRPSKATIGGVLALGEGGFRRRPGARPRDLLLGFEAVLADGTRVKSGGRVVKNVAGYELSKLFVGSAGTLAVLTRAFLRLRAIPETVVTLALVFPRLAHAARAFHAVARQSVLPEAVALLSPELSREQGWDDWTLLSRFEGFREETSEGVDEARKQAEPGRTASTPGVSVWDELRDFPTRPLGERELLLRGQAAPARTFALAESWQDGGPLVAYPDSGIVYSHTRDLEALANRRESAALSGANVVVEGAPSSVKNEVDVFGEIPESFEIMKRIKEKLDPAGILSPGRFVGRF